MFDPYFDSGGGPQYIGPFRVRATDLKIGLWVLDILELILSIIILGITGSSSEGMKNDFRWHSIPGKLVYNIVVATLSMISLFPIIFIDVARPSWMGYLSSNPARQPWSRIALNVLFTGLWIGTIPASFFTCNDLCSAAGSQFSEINFATLYCECYNVVATEYRSLAPREVFTEQRTGRYEATEGLNILLSIVFIVSTILLVVSHWIREEGHAGAPEMSADVRGHVEA